MKATDDPIAILLVLDSVGIGEAPDAADYGDAGANTLAHLARAVNGVRLPVLEQMGLGLIPPLLPKGLPIEGVSPTREPTASYGAMQEVSRGKDTTTGHWEMAGLELAEGLRVFPPDPPSFPPDLIAEFERRTGRRVIGNCAASGTAIIADLGERHLREGCWIVYTSADSVLQIAAHEETIPLPELYRGCEIARELCNPLRVGRVIARPFVGKPGAFQRTGNRRDFSLPPPEPTLLDRLHAAGVSVTTVGKLDDIFAHRGITRTIHSESSRAAEEATFGLLDEGSGGFVFVNLIDFDMRYGHRRDPVGYAGALVEADRFIGRVADRLHARDLLIVTADHGNDPTFKGTDHTREFVPLLVYRPGKAGRNLGIRHGFYDAGQSVAAFFGIEPLPRGVSFL